MKNDLVKLAPSIPSANFARLGEEVTEAEQAGADRIHVDVMDGHFVPNIAIGAPIVQSLRQVTKLPMETYLMTSNPDLILDGFSDAGSTSFLVHSEGNNHLQRTVQHIKSLGNRAGVAINPVSSIAVLEEILPDLDQVLVIAVNPGFGDQHFLTSTLPKIRRVALMIEQFNPHCELGVDGGIDEVTAPQVVAAGGQFTSSRYIGIWRDFRDGFFATRNKQDATCRRENLCN